MSEPEPSRGLLSTVMFPVLQRLRALMIFVGLVIAVAAVVALVRPRRYEAGVTLATVGNPKLGGGLSSTLAASVLGGSGLNLGLQATPAIMARLLTLDGIAHDGGLLVPLSLSVAIVAGWLFVRRQRRLPVPMLPVELFRRPAFSLSVATAIAAYMAQSLAIVSLPFFFIAVASRTQVEAGLLMTAWPIAVAAVAPFSGRMADRHPVGLLAAAASPLAASGLDEGKFGGNLDDGKYGQSIDEGKYGQNQDEGKLGRNLDDGKHGANADEGKYGRNLDEGKFGAATFDGR